MQGFHSLWTFRWIFCRISIFYFQSISGICNFKTLHTSHLVYCLFEQNEWIESIDLDSLQTSRYFKFSTIGYGHRVMLSSSIVVGTKTVLKCFVLELTAQEYEVKTLWKPRTISYLCVFWQFIMAFYQLKLLNSSMLYWVHCVEQVWIYTEIASFICVH